MTGKADAKVTRRKLTDYTPDPHNANRGTERGQYMLDRSIEETGAGRSLVAAADDRIAAGNGTLQALVDAGIVDVIEVETDGHTAVVVKRTDWANIDDPTARKYSYFDNRTSQIRLAWNVEQLIADVNAGVDLSEMFHPNELTRLLTSVAADEDEDEDTLTRLKHDAVFPLAIVLSVQDLRRWQAVKERLGYKDDTSAFVAWLNEGEGDD